MGLFSRLFGKSEPAIEDPEQLRAAVFDAARADDRRLLERLARTNERVILQHFRRWQRVPDAMRSDPAAMQEYVGVLVLIAEVFAARLGRMELMESLTGPPETNPLTRWQNSLSQAREMMDNLRYAEARALLTDVLIDTRSLQGTGVERYLPITHGYVGESYFQTGEAQLAIAQFEQALTLCERSGDTDGIAAYLASLFESHRYLGQSTEAAQYAARSAELLEQSGKSRDAARWQTRARIVQAGEPLNRIVAVVDGATLELDELQPTENLHVQFVFERNRPTLRPAEVLTEQGKELGATGRHEEALARFREAGCADAFDPHCRFLEAFTLLHLRQYADAAECYRRVEELAPGWFHCRADAWIADQLLLGHLEFEDFVTLHGLEDGPESPEKKVALARKLVARRPSLPVAHLHLGRNLNRTGRESDAEAAFRIGLKQNADPDVRTRLLVELGVLIKKPGEREALLREAIALNGNLVATATATLALRTTIPRGAG